MCTQTKRHKIARVAKAHARAAFMAAAGLVASAAAHAQHAAARPAPASQQAPLQTVRPGTPATPAELAAAPASDSPPVTRRSSSPIPAGPPDWHAYLEANRRVLAGQADLAAAMGLTGAAGQAADAAGTLGGDGAAASPVSDTTLSQIGGAQQSIALALSQAFASAPGAPLDREAFRTGLAALGEGLQRFEGLQQGEPAPASLDAASSSIAGHAPDQIDAAASTLSDAVRYASLHGIDVPPVAASALRRIAR
ncbi:hypothetical protein B7760_03717 [Burkholderia glumae]|uniref:hypothetical protein n=1 Tax=Burkholderia glumae TaxID=337 RepID=UPI001373A5F4|nr:hypothetical protein [Burkholderia glumae]MCR1767107.1 hypothetical protein [Burkholderia glumae]QHP94185.1 hypothetical protein EXE55_25610 [Burkholderia glumae]QKM49659.1 hypothetical protein B7760_03717 [Burkholderia glumae]